MFIFKRMDPDAGPGAGAGEAGKTESSKFDPEKFKEDMATQNKEMFSSMTETMTNSIRSTVEEVLAAQGGDEGDTAAPTGGGKMQEKFHDEMERLGLDEDQATALSSMLTKIVQEQAPAIKKEVVGEVSKKDKFKEDRQTANVKVAQQYPDIAVENSVLRKQANKIFAAYSEAEQVNPRAMANATRAAAADLGIPPLTKEQILQNDAQNPTGGAPRSGGVKGPNDADYEFAAAFGVGKEKFKEKMKIVEGRRGITRAG